MPIAAKNFHPGGLIKSDIAGRTDKIPTNVPADSYIIPADIVSGLGQGNTLAGRKVLDHLFPASAKAHLLAAASHVGEGHTVSKHLDHRDRPVIIAGGEYNVVPEDVQNRGRGNLKKGHAVLDAWVVHTRQKIINEMKNLKPPVGSNVKKKVKK